MPLIKDLGELTFGAKRGNDNGRHARRVSRRLPNNRRGTDEGSEIALHIERPIY